MRERHSLDGAWLFQYDKDGSLTPQTVAPQREVVVPMPWQAQCEDLHHKGGVAWYVRRFELGELAGHAAVLHFGAVDYHATVWLNGAFVGEHEGGYLPFEFEVAAALRAGENELVVRVADVEGDGEDGSGYPFDEILHGKQSWYGPLSGIWQPVWLERRPQRHLRRLRLTPDCDMGTIEVLAVLSAADANCQLLLQVRDARGQMVGEQWAETAKPGIVKLEAPVQRWEIGQGTLYTVTAELWQGGRRIDSLSDHCGFRTIATRDGRITINEQAIYLRGALDQGYYPRTIYTPPGVAFLEAQARKAQALGLNCLRSHIKIEDPRYYDVADRLGLLVWAELPSWGRLTPASARRAAETFRGMVERDWNHPSIFAWSLVNEDWGTDLRRDATHRRWLLDFYRQAREIDGTRLVVDNSPCAPTFHVASDIEDYHHYRLIPDHASEWDEWVADFAGGADWAWSTNHGENRHDGLPRVVSEFGQWGLPHPDSVREDGAEPWWFENGLHWGDGAVYPHGVRRRFQFWGLEKVFGSFNQFVAAHQRQMAKGLNYAIGSMRQWPAIGGYVITELTDVHWEANGLMDMQRNVKQYMDALINVNQDRVVLIRPQHWSGSPGTEIAVDVQAFDVNGAAHSGMLQWQSPAAGAQIAAPGGRIRVPLPLDAAGSEVRVHLRWVDGAGQTLAADSVALSCPQTVTMRPALRVVDDDPLAEALAAMGYPLAAKETALWVARSYTPACREAVKRGDRLLLITDGVNDEPLPVGRVAQRAGTSWQGDWASSFSWLRREGPFAGLPGGPLLDMSFASVMPVAVLDGLPAWLMRDHSWAGLAVGWLHKHVSLLARMRHGQGQIVVTTFRLTPDVLALDAVAQALFAGMVALLVAES